MLGIGIGALQHFHLHFELPCQANHADHCLGRIYVAALQSAADQSDLVVDVGTASAFDAEQAIEPFDQI